MTEFKNKSVLVTGAGRGLGCYIARAFGAQGASVCVNYAHSEEGANQVVSEIEVSGGKAFACKADISNVTEVKSMIEQIMDHYGGIDILVNNAGLSRDGSFLEMTENAWDTVIAANLKGPFLVSQRVAKQMVKGRGGVIVNISATTTTQGRANAANYCASKAGLNMLTKCMALELGPTIRVNGVGLGFVDSPLVQALYSEEQIQSVVESTPLRRMTSNQETAQFVKLLASESTAFVTGQTIMFDGGRNMR
ncbi:MAG: 3-oxoacyl-ACP reductase FabG [Acidiferrobacterales bacterium]|nr:3-oxoacyl-ACP reductase FabG [Acidiferrobacterales bacterium]